MTATLLLARLFVRSSHQTRIAPLIAVERKIARLLPTRHPLSSGVMASKFARDDLKIQMNAKQRQGGEGRQGHQKIEAKGAHCRAFSSLTALKVKEPVHATLG